MRRLIVAFLAVALSSAAALAADLPLPPIYPIKAPAKVVCTPSKCSGWYLGFVAGTNTQSTNVLPTLTSVSGGNGVFGGDFGWRFWNGNFYFGAEADALMQTGQSGAAISFNPTNFMGIVEFKTGLNMADFFNFAPPAASQGPLQSVNAQLLSYLMTAYIVPVADCINNTGGGTWVQRYCGGAGMEFAIGGPFTVAAEYLNIPAAANLKPANLFLLKGQMNF